MVAERFELTLSEDRSTWNTKSSPKKTGTLSETEEQPIAADPPLAAPCGAVPSLAAPRALVCSTWNANKSLAENAGPELFHVERVHGHKPLQVALICFTWNVTESLTAAANPCLVPRGTPAVLS